MARFKVGQKVRILISAKYPHVGAKFIRGCIGVIDMVRPGIHPLIGAVYGMPHIIREDGPYAFSEDEISEIGPLVVNVPESKSVRERKNKRNPKIFIS